MQKENWIAGIPVDDRRPTLYQQWDRTDDTGSFNTVLLPIEDLTALLAPSGKPPLASAGIPVDDRRAHEFKGGGLTGRLLCISAVSSSAFSGQHNTYSSMC